MVVSTPTHEPILSAQACLNCSVVIQNRNFLVSLICVPLVQLDIILGMDWLSHNHVMLDCFSKSLIFKTEYVISLESPRFVFAKQIKAALREGALGYMIMFSLGVVEEKKIVDTLVVRDYPEVFPHDIPGL